MEKENDKLRKVLRRKEASALWFGLGLWCKKEA